MESEYLAFSVYLNLYLVSLIYNLYIFRGLVNTVKRYCFFSRNGAIEINIIIIIIIIYAIRQ